jgi:hypothetical protein
MMVVKGARVGPQKPLEHQGQAVKIYVIALYGEEIT